MKTSIARFDFSHIGCLCLMGRIVAAGFVHFPVLTSVLAGAYIAAWIAKLTLGLLEKYQNRLLGLQAQQISEIGGAVSELKNNAGRITNKTPAFSVNA